MVSRIRPDIQFGTSPFPNSVLVSNNGSLAQWLAPTTGGDRIMWYKNGAAAWQSNLSIGAGLSIVGDTLQASVSSAGYDTVQLNTTPVGPGNNILNFITPGFSVTDAGSGRTDIQLTANLKDLSDLNTPGIVSYVGSNNFEARTLQGTAGRVTITNPDGVSGAPIFNIDPNFSSSNLFDASNIALLNANQTFTGNNTFNNNVVMNDTPVLDAHLVTKSYVDDLILDRKGTFVDAATDSPITLSGEQTIDTYNTNNSRILVKDQVDPRENGYYDTNTGAWTRTTDMNQASEVKGSLALVAGGTQQGQIWYTLSEVTTLESDAINFVQLATSTLLGFGAPNRATFWSDVNTLTYTDTYVADGTRLAVGEGSLLTNTRINTRAYASDVGFGYVHRNNAGNNVFSVADTGDIVIGTATSTTLNKTSITRADDFTIQTTASGKIYLTSAWGGSNAINLTTTGSSGGVFIINTSATSTAPVLTVGNTVAWTYTTGQNFLIDVAGSYTASSGTGIFTGLYVAPVINQTGTANGWMRGVSVVPDLVDADNFTAFHTEVPGYSAIDVTGEVRLNIGSDATGDLLVRGASGFLERLPVGTSGQVLVGGTTPTWASLPLTPEECYIEPQSGEDSTTFDLDANIGLVKDRDGTNIAFTLPADHKRLKVYRNGQRVFMTGSVTTRDYTLDIPNSVITFTTIVNEGERIYISKES